jgi:hypothetical protein
MIGLIKTLLSFSINGTEIEKMIVRWWTRFGGYKSLGVFIKINVCKKR